MRILRVKGVGDALVSNPHAERSIRFVGKLWNGKKAADGLPHPLCFDNVEETIADHSDVRSAVKKGCLTACDEATAKLCGVKLKALAPKEGK